LKSVAYFLAIDQGTTSSRSIIFSQKGDILGVGQKEFRQYFPKPGWVEHDAVEIWESQIDTIKESIRSAGLNAGDITAMGITNQRETVVAWDAETGVPLAPAIVWQDRRTSDICQTLKANGLEPYIQEVTGLRLDAYFSATKMLWMLNHLDKVAEASRKGSLRFGTIDSWLLWNLTKREKYLTDPSNASRTLLYDIRNNNWDEYLLRQFSVSQQNLPQINPSCGFFGKSHPAILGKPIPITAILGDQQAALYGHDAWNAGEAKSTFGTGCFVLLNTGKTLVRSAHGSLTTVAWQKENSITYALEGSVFSAGSAVQWLRDGLGLIQKSAETETLAKSILQNDGVYVVPAFTGLGAPYWDMEARGLITGLTRGTTKAHLVRATLESIAYQTYDLMIFMEKDAGFKFKSIYVDGGATNNNFLMQFLSDILEVTVIRPDVQEMTALGIAKMAAEGVGARISKENSKSTVFYPQIPREVVKQWIDGWHDAVKRARSTQ